MSLQQQLIGMDKQDAINLLHSKGLTVRIAAEDGVSNNLQSDYVPGRVDLTIVDGKVSGAHVP